jgi:hypothetical protein
MQFSLHIPTSDNQEQPATISCSLSTGFWSRLWLIEEYFVPFHDRFLGFIVTLIGDMAKVVDNMDHITSDYKFVYCVNVSKHKCIII